MGCAGDAKTRACWLEFLDHHNKTQVQCITNQTTPSADNAECQDLHASNPDLQNSTVHLFSKSGYLTTCYPDYSPTNTKGWCATRRPGIFTNEIPEPNSGWGFCSTDKSQEHCNGRIREANDEGIAHKMSILNNKHCENLLKENLKIDQPDVFENEGENAINNMMHRAKTLCVGQVHKHSFANELFYFKRVTEGKTYEAVHNQLIPKMKVLFLKRYIYVC